MQWIDNTFGSRFCRLHRCSSADFSETVFRCCLHRRGLPIATALRWFNPHFFKEDFWLIEEAGHAQSRRDLELAINGFHEDCRARKGFLHHQMRIRLSGRKLLKLFCTIMAAAPLSSEPAETEQVPRSTPSL